jgi:hypothetical protein
LRRAADRTISGTITDSVRRRPVEVAELVFSGDGGSRQLQATGGIFEVELPDGAWKLTVSAPGHLPESVRILVPHRGELRKLRVSLVAIRERVFELYRRAAEPLLPKPDLWGIWTPRQVVDHVRRARRSPALSSLTDLVEEVYFSPRPPVDYAILETEERVAAAVAEQTQPPERPPPVQPEV